MTYTTIWRQCSEVRFESKINIFFRGKENLGTMFRRTLNLLQQKGARTIVRDPRRKAKVASSSLVPQQEPKDLSSNPFPPSSPFPFPQQSQIAPGLGSYVLMGAGMSLGFAVVGLIFGSF
jgi:hypothetical protein